MTSVKKYFLAITGGLILFAAVLYLFVLILLPHIIDANKYKSQIFLQIKQETGFEITVEDLSFKTKFNPYLNLKAHHFKIKYPNGNTFIKVTDADLRIKVFPLLLRKIELDSIKLNRPIIDLTLYSDGSTSLERYIKQLQSKTAFNKKLNNGFKFVPKISSIKASRYKLKVQDVSLYSPFLFEGDKLLLSNFKYNDGVRIKTKGTLSAAGVKYFNYDIDVDTFLQEKKDSKFFKSSPFSNIYKYSSKGNIFARLKISRKGKLPEFKGNILLSNFSFKVGSNLLADNNLKLIFSGQTVDVDASVHTDNKNIATIVGKANYGAKPNIDLEVKALNSDLANLHELVVATLSSLNIKNKFKDYSVSGLADLDFKIKSNFKKIESSGVSKITDASIVCKKSPLKITRINSNIDFSNNVIKINKSSALVNSTPVHLTGNINSDAVMELDIFGSELPLKEVYKNFLASDKYKNYSVDKGNLSFKISAIGKLKDLKIKVDSGITDLALKDSKTNSSLTALNTKLIFKADKNSFTSQLSLKDVLLDSETIKTKFETKKILLDINPKNVLLEPSLISIDGEPISIKGEVLDYKTDPLYDLSFEGALSSKGIYKKLKTYYNIPASAKGKLPVIGSVKGKKNNLKLDLQFSSNDSNYLSFVVIDELLNNPSRLDVSLALNKDNIDVLDVSLYKMASGQKKSDNSLTGSQKIISLNGNMKNFSDPSVENFRINIPQSLTMSIASLNSSELSVKSDLTLNGKIKSPKISGNLYVNKLFLPDYNLKAGDVNITFKPDNINLKTSKLNIKNSAFDINANISPDFLEIITVKDLKFIASNLDLTTLTNSFTPALGKGIYPGVHLPLKILTGNAIISNFNVGEINAKNITSDLSLDNNLLKLSNVQGEAYNGKVWGSVNYDFLKSLADIKLSGKNLDAPQAMYALTGIKDNLKGKLDFKANVSNYGYTKNQRIKTLNGVSDIYAYNGQMGTLGKFEHYLYAQNLMSQTLMRSTVNVIAQTVASRDTGRFKYLKMHITFSDGFANVNNMSFSGPNMSMFSTGRLNMLSGWGDFDILGKVSSEVVNVIGPFGELSLANIVSKIPKLNSVTLPNIFYKNYNLQVTQDVLNKIPDLTPKTDLKTKNFNVKINGNVGSVKSVKSFKWISLQQIEQTTSSVEQVETKTTNEPVTQKIYNVFNNKTNQQGSTEVHTLQPIPVYSQTKQAPLPDFLNDLPDDIK